MGRINRVLNMAKSFLMPNYGEMKLEIVSGKGTEVITRDVDGHKQKCLDFLCGLGVTSLGHCHPAVVSAIRKQSQKLMHVSNLYATEPMVKLASMLAGIAPHPSKVSLYSSGTEANEAAGKLVRMWAYMKFGPGKNEIVALRNSFHGRTFLSISMTGQDKMQEKFSPIVPGIKFVELNDVQALHRTVSRNTCAIIFEPIQAEGGINVMIQTFYDSMVNLAREHKCLLIADEVQTGLGRTGKMFAFEHYGSPPDIICLAKSLGGGLPIGAVIAKFEIADYMVPGSHAATFGGNPVACAAAIAVLNVIRKKNLVERADNIGRYFLHRLKSIDDRFRKINEVRGRGLMVGVELNKPYAASAVVAGMRGKDVLVGTAGPQVVRFLPPLIVKKKEIDKIIEKFKEVIEKI